jgi:hypothetical protein
MGMASASGLTRRRAGAGSNGGLDSSLSPHNNTNINDDNLDAGTASWSPLDADDRFDKRPPMSKRGSESNVNASNGQRQFESYDDDDDDEADKGKKVGSRGKYKLTMLEEVLLLGLKDAQVGFFLRLGLIIKTSVAKLEKNHRISKTLIFFSRDIYRFGMTIFPTSFVDVFLLNYRYETVFELFQKYVNDHSLTG